MGAEDALLTDGGEVGIRKELVQGAAVGDGPVDGHVLGREGPDPGARGVLFLSGEDLADACVTHGKGGAHIAKLVHANLELGLVLGVCLVPSHARLQEDLKGRVEPGALREGHAVAQRWDQAQFASEVVVERGSERTEVGRTDGGTTLNQTVLGEQIARPHWGRPELRRHVVLLLGGSK